MNDGAQGAVLITSEKNDAVVDRYDTLLEKVLRSNDKSMLGSFILTIGVVSNHGNWFSVGNMNKETKLLAQAYDWLLFLTDAGLADFINELIVHPEESYRPVSTAFKASYDGSGKPTRFTKTMMDFKADQCLRRYFMEHQDRIRDWFNVLAPTNRDLMSLKDELYRLRDKPWREILA